MVAVGWKILMLSFKLKESYKFFYSSAERSSIKGRIHKMGNDLTKEEAVIRFVTSHENQSLWKDTKNFGKMICSALVDVVYD